MSVKQKRPDDLINILAADYQSRYEHGFAWASICAMFLDLPGLRAFWSTGDVDQYGKLIDASGQGNTLTNNNTALVNTRPLPPYIEFKGSEFLTQATGAGGVALGAGTLDTTTTNDTSIPNHTHAVTTTSDANTNPSTIVAGDANGRAIFDALGIGGAASGTNRITVPERIDHLGDANTYHTFPAVDQWRVVCGGVTMVDFIEGANDYVNFGVYVGIGIVPGLSLHVFHAANTGIFKAESGTANSQIILEDPSDLGYFQLLTSGADILSLGFTSGYSATNLNIDPIGHVGIGVIPATKFDIGAGAMELTEWGGPGAGAVNTARLYARDNGAGKTQLVVIFNTGAVQVLAVQP